MFSGPPPAGCTSGLPPAGGSRASPRPDKVMLAQQQDAAIPAKRLRVDNGDGLTQGLGGVSGGDGLRPLSSTRGGQGVVMPLLSSQTNTTTITEIQMKIAKNKRILFDGKGSENINLLQSKSGANIKIIPKFLPYNDTSTESTIYIDGKPENVEKAKALVNDIISEGYKPPPRQWGHPGNPPKRESGYGFEPPGGFLSVPPQACRSNSQTSRSALPQVYGVPPHTGNNCFTSGIVPPQARIRGQIHGSYQIGQVQHMANSYTGNYYHGQTASTSVPLPPPPPPPPPRISAWMPPPPPSMPPLPPPPPLPPLPPLPPPPPPLPHDRR